MIGYRHMPRTEPSWSPYRLSDADLRILAGQIARLARDLGFAIAPDVVRRAALEHSDAVELRFGGDRRDGFYLEYPMETRETADEPVRLRAHAADRLLDGLHRQRWRAARRDALAACGDVGRMGHFDGDALARWTRAMAINRPDRLTRHSPKPCELDDAEIRANAVVATSAGAIGVGSDQMRLPVPFTATLATGAVGAHLGTLVGLPSCGDEAIDAEVGELAIREAKADGSTGTSLTTGYAIRRPYEPGAEDSEWRRLRRVRPFVRRAAPDYAEIDRAATRRGYRAACREAGVATPATIRLVREGAPEGGPPNGRADD